jgi:DNA invertase Pin-like site-specific DNA recombinase
MKKVIVIVRTSTVKQEIDSQLNEILEYVISEGYSPDEIVVIADGKVKEAGPREEILPHLLAQPHMACCPQGKVEVGYE